MALPLNISLQALRPLTADLHQGLCGGSLGFLLRLGLHVGPCFMLRLLALGIERHSWLSSLQTATEGLLSPVTV